VTITYRAGTDADGQQIAVRSAWILGEPVWRGVVGERSVAVQVRAVPNGFDLAWHGSEVRAYVYTETEAAAARLMPIKVRADTGKKLRCPMPGLVIAIAVAVGQEVKAGETLAIVEAMKMENVLRAERDGVVKTIHAKKGDSLAVDAVILEFE
jgi:propionyl-CoA carboxylase alpha chain